MFFRVCDCTAGLGFAGQNRPAKCACMAFASSTKHAAARRHEGACSPIPHPPQRQALASMRFVRSWALRSRLGAGGARRLTPSHIAQQRFKNQKPFSKENQRAPGLTPPSPAGNSSRTTFKACNLAQHRTRGLQSDWSASQTEKSTQNKGSRTRISGFKKRESPRQEAFSLNVRLMVRLASYFSTPAMAFFGPRGRVSFIFRVFLH